MACDLRPLHQSTAGWVELWFDGEWQTLSNGQRRKAINATDGTAGMYTMGGIYRGSAHGGTSVVFSDDYRKYRVQ